MNLLEAQQLSFFYPSRGDSPKTIIHNLDLSVIKGEFLCLLGPSGCGKSTLLKLLSGFLLPSKGSVYYGTHRIDAPFKQGQMVFQDPSQLLPWLTVEQNIRFSERKKIPQKNTSLSEKDRVKEILSLTGLEEYKDYYPAQLSGGMKQRCALGRALYVNPDILFMDEPFVSLDAPSRSVLQNLLLNIWKTKGTTIIFVTHDIREALILSEKLLIFSKPDGGLSEESNKLPYPRMGCDEAFIKEESRLYSLIESSSGIT